MSASNKDSGKQKQKATVNTVEQTILSPSERILKECHSLYTDPKKGLISIASTLGLTLLAPRKKITVLLIGNHSAGKSSFINWYVEEHIQRTGVAIETQGFTIVTSGKRRESLTGNATLHLYPHFEPLRKLEGVVDYLTTEVSSSKARKFSLVQFIDTPGLVDGDLKYQFDVNAAIEWLGSVADLIFVFFDPIGQALCKRTLNLVEKLNARYADRIRFYLAKADEAGSESDRQRVLMQIVQELCRRPTLNKTGFDMPTVYIPSLARPNARCINQIDNITLDVERTIDQTVQNTLNTLESDCQRIAALVDSRLRDDTVSRGTNFRRKARACFFASLAFLVPVCCALFFSLPLLLSSPYAEQFPYEPLVRPVANFSELVSANETVRLWSIVVVVLFTFICAVIAKWNARSSPVLSRADRRTFAELKHYVENVVINAKQQLYTAYLQQSVTDHDLSL